LPSLALSAIAQLRARVQVQITDGTFHTTPGGALLDYDDWNGSLKIFMSACADASAHALQAILRCA
jgi:hypothetical protein